MSRDPMISALGTTVRLDTAALAQHDRDELHRVWADARANDDEATDAAVVALPADLATAQLLATTSQRVTLAAITSRRGELWMLHAAGIADDEGRVVVVIGPSGRGKTTAARSLAQHYAYVTDETVGIDGEGRVYPYRKPLSVIETVGESKAQHAPSELGLGALPGAPLRVAALVLLDRRTDAPDVAVVDQCDLGDVIEELVEQTSYLADVPRPLHTIAAHVDAVGGMHRVVYREADSLAEALAPLFRASSSLERDQGETDSGGDDARASMVPLTEAEPPRNLGWHRAPVLDVLELGSPDRVAVMRADAWGGATLRVLGGIGPTLWRGATGRTTEELLALVVAEHGEPASGEARAIVGEAITELVSQGVLVAHDDASFMLSDTPSRAVVE